MKRFLCTIFTTFSVVAANPCHAAPEPAIHPAVVIGGGIGALTAAVYLQRAGIDTLVIEGDEPGGAIAQSPAVHNWPGELEINGQELADKVKNQAVANGATFLSEKVTEVDFSGKTFTINSKGLFSDQVTKTRAQSVIIAVGSKPKMLGVAGEQGYWTKGVYSCAVCDGGLYKGRKVAVVGGGDSAIIEADYLSNLAEKVYVILRKDDFRTVETVRKNKLIEKDNVEILYNTEVDQIFGNGTKVTHLGLSTKKNLDVDGVFIAIGAEPNTGLFSGHIDLDETGHIVLSEGQQTSVPGVFAIGDVVDREYKQAVSAAGDGAKAAMDVEGYLAGLPKIEAKTVANSIATGTVEELTSMDQFYETIKSPDVPVVIDFYSPYCGPCRKLAPELEKMAGTYKGKARFIKVNTTKFQQLTDQYNIYGVPTVILFDTNGKVVDRGTGLGEIDKVLKKLDKMV